MAQRVIILQFEEDSLSYQAFSEVKQLVIKRQIKVGQMAIMQHEVDNDKKENYVVKDYMDFSGKNRGANDGLIGMLLGALVGPFGLLFGWLTGTMIGSVRDSKELNESRGILQYIAENINENRTGVILIADEEDNRPLNQLVFQQLGGQITRFDLAEVEQELKEAQEKAQTGNTQNAENNHTTE